MPLSMTSIANNVVSSYYLVLTRKLNLRGLALFTKDFKDSLYQVKRWPPISPKLLPWVRISTKIQTTQNINYFSLSRRASQGSSIKCCSTISCDSLKAKVEFRKVPKGTNTFDRLNGKILQLSLIFGQIKMFLFWISLFYFLQKNLSSDNCFCAI